MLFLMRSLPSQSVVVGETFVFKTVDVLTLPGVWFVG